MAALLLSGCWAAGTPDAGLDAGPPAPPPRPDELDVLFVVQNSNGIGDRTQASLVAALPSFFRALVSGDHDGDGVAEVRPFRSIHAGVVTTDMGTGGFSVPTCARADFGDDGILRTRALADASCSETYPAVLESDASADAEAFALDVGCLVHVGSGGCGFEQPLEAMLKAISPRAPRPGVSTGFVPIGRPGAPSGLDRPFFRMSDPHGDGANSAFLREGSLLAVLVFADEDDCSFSDPSLFDSTSPAYAGTDLSLRCIVHEDAALHPIERYVAGLVQLRRHPSLVAFLPLAGVPRDLEPASGAAIEWDVLVSEDASLRDDRLERVIDPAMPNRILPSCSDASGVAFPPDRLLRVARGLDAHGARVAVGSLCQDGYDTAFASFLEVLSR